MPIYLDRHDIPDEITAEHVAEMHQKDLEVQHEFGCRGFTYWFDEKRKTGFCLIEAPNKEALIKMHDHAHGAIPSEIIEVEERFVEAFLGRLEDPVKTKDEELIIRESAFRVIMLSRVKMTSLLRRDHNGDDIQGFNKSIVHLLKRHRGRIVETDHNHFLFSFVSLSNALECALEMQSEFEKFTGHSSDSGLHLKIGLSCGVPVNKKEKLFEDHISLSSDLCEGVSGKIAISYEIKNLAQSEQLNLTNEKKLVHALTYSEEQFLVQFMDHLSRHWQKTDLNLEDICENLGLSQSKLYRLMKSIAAKSPNTFIRDYRLDKALELLRIQKDNISEIAFDTGFNSPSYFSKCFLQKYGMLPSSYLKMLANPSLSRP